MRTMSLQKSRWPGSLVNPMAGTWMARFNTESGVNSMLKYLGMYILTLYNYLLQTNFQ
jgi:hypothetical protein